MTGLHPQTFFTLITDQKADPPDMHSSTSSVGGIIGGVVASVVVIVVAGVVVFVFRRRICKYTDKLLVFTSVRQLLFLGL